MIWHKITRDYKYSERHIVGRVLAQSAFTFKWDVRSPDYYDDGVKLAIAGYTHYAVVDNFPEERMCNYCGGNVEIRNPTGRCDHLHYPDNVNKKHSATFPYQTDPRKLAADSPYQTDPRKLAADSPYQRGQAMSEFQRCRHVDAQTQGKYMIQWQEWQGCYY